MVFPSRRAFFLPMVWLLAAAVLTAAWLWLEAAASSARSRQQLSAADQARQSLRAQIPALRQLLNQHLAGDGSPASFQQNHPRSGARATFLTTNNESDQPPRPVYSHSPDPENPSIRFASPFGPPLHADAWPLHQNDHGAAHWFFAMEDIALAAPSASPPDWYPVPHYNWIPLTGPLPDPPARLHAPPPQSVLPVRSTEPIPFQPEASPPVAPVLLGAALRFGIFASGPLRQYEKPVRLRFFIEAVLWNPYDRPLQLHSGSGKRPVARLLVHHLPEVAIHNESTGRASGWLSLDHAPNSASGKTGLSAWLEAPPSIPPGAVLRLTGPDPTDQPEGLARTLHPAFRIGPADTVRLRFRPTGQPPALTALPWHASDPPQAAAAGQGWLRLRHLNPPSWPTLLFPRADQEPAPFFLHGGSLAFRSSHAQGLLRFSAAPPIRQFLTDPRAHLVDGRSPYRRPDGSIASVADWYSLQFHDLRSGPAPPTPDPPKGALFPYPETNQPPPMLQLALPGNPNSFRLGAPASPSRNAPLASPAFLAALRPDQVSPETAPLHGAPIPFLPVFPVNQTDPASWQDLLSLQNHHLLPAAAQFIARQIDARPLPSVPAFFDQGILPQAVAHAGADPRQPDLPFRPLRSQLTSGPVLAAHGPAWLLHLAVQYTHRGQTLRLSARLWFHYLPPSPDEAARFTVLRFQWTDPQQHLLP